MIEFIVYIERLEDYNIKYKSLFENSIKLKSIVIKKYSFNKLYFNPNYVRLYKLDFKIDYA